MKTYNIISTIVGILFLFVFTLSNGILAQENKWIIYDTINSELPANWINSIAVGNDGNVWIGAGSYSGGGVAKLVLPVSSSEGNGSEENVETLRRDAQFGRLYATSLLCILLIVSL